MSRKNEKLFLSPSRLKEEELQASIINLTQKLVRIPSQGGIDDSRAILDCLGSWLEDQDIETRMLYPSQSSLSKSKPKQVVGIESEIGNVQGPIYCLNACADTAPVGNKKTWDYNPFSGEVVNGWLYGRGSADSKIAVAIFAHILVNLKSFADRFKGQVSLLVDADEHTGHFGGIKRYVESRSQKIAGVFIGYPGNIELKIGARGFYRTHITVYGTAQHSGTSKPIVGNAITKAVLLVNELSRVSLADSFEPNFPLKPSLNVTAIKGGQSYSIIPDLCEVKVDIRLTPKFQKNSAQQLIKEVVTKVDRDFSTYHKTQVKPEQSWPAYRLPDDSLIVRSLFNAAQYHFKHQISTTIAGPSNVGNYLASKKIDATCGFGVTFKNIHAANEGIEIDSILPSYYTYQDAILNLLTI
jgi:succinyl-diaminopimelate desuccinylase